MPRTPGNSTDLGMPIASVPDEAPPTPPDTDLPSATGRTRGGDVDETGKRAQPGNDPAATNTGATPGATPGVENRGGTPSTTSGIANEESAGPGASSGAIGGESVGGGMPGS